MVGTHYAISLRRTAPRHAAKGDSFDGFGKLRLALHGPGQKFFKVRHEKVPGTALHMVSTFLTMVYVPILYSLFEDLQHWAAGLVRRAEPQAQKG